MYRENEVALHLKPCLGNLSITANRTNVNGSMSQDISLDLGIVLDALGVLDWENLRLNFVFDSELQLQYNQTLLSSGSSLVGNLSFLQTVLPFLKARSENSGEYALSIAFDDFPIGATYLWSSTLEITISIAE